jgi:hypothetical protein
VNRNRIVKRFQDLFGFEWDWLNLHV